MVRRRYQQGIGIPETLGVQPTTWTEPTAPAVKQTTWTSPNSGATRNYGSTPSYVDTVPHRWTVPEPGKFFDALKEIGTSAGRLRQSRINSAPSPFSAPPSGPPATGAGVPAHPYMSTSSPAPNPSTAVSTNLPTPANQATVATTPAPAWTGTPPSAPSVKQTQQIIKTTNPMSLPPMPEFGGDFITTSAREASDEPFESGVEWKDEPENPFPKGGREDFDTSRMFDPTYKPAQERSTKPANSRTQKRKPKNI